MSHYMSVHAARSALWEWQYLALTGSLVKVWRRTFRQLHFLITSSQICISINHFVLTQLRLDGTFWLLHPNVFQFHPNQTRRDGQMSRAPASHAGRSGNPKITVSSPDPVGLISGPVKPVTLKLILVTS